MYAFSLAAAIGLAASAFLVMPASAAAPSVGRIGLGGPGCPAGSATAAVSGDGTILTIRFTEFEVEAGGARTVDRKACALAIPFTAPPGHAVALLALTYRGDLRLPAGAQATLSAETFFAGGQGPTASHTVDGPLTSRFSATTGATATVWSACGAATNLRVNTSLRVETTTGRAASASIRSQDVDAALIYQLRLRKC
jgi:hypothetical protein